MNCKICGISYWSFYSGEKEVCDDCSDPLESDKWYVPLDEFDQTEIDCLVNGAARRTKTNINSTDDNDTDSFSS